MWRRRGSGLSAMSSEEAVVPVSMLSERCRGFPSKVFALVQSLPRNWPRVSFGLFGGQRLAGWAASGVPKNPFTASQIGQKLSWSCSSTSHHARRTRFGLSLFLPTTTAEPCLQKTQHARSMCASSPSMRPARRSASTPGSPPTRLLARSNSIRRS